MTVPIEIQNVDLRGLSLQLAGIADVFYRRGSGPTALQKLIETEAGLLAADAANVFPPKSLAAGTARAQRDVKMFLDSNYSETAGAEKYTVFERSNQGGSGDVQWLTAGPDWLLGIRRGGNRLGESSAAAYEILRQEQKRGSRGPAYQQLGVRGRQRVKLLNRVRVEQSAFKGVLTRLGQKFGVGKASFAMSAVALNVHRRFAAFVTRHFGPDGATQQILDRSGLSNGPMPSVVLGSHAPGVESNGRVREALLSAVMRREKISEAKLKKMVAGAVYNLNTGQVYQLAGRSPEEDEI